VALCIVTNDLVAYADGYNRVSMAAVNRKFGHDVFKECAEEAERKWKAEKALQRSKPLLTTERVSPPGQ
jgi:hypothetical protein